MADDSVPIEETGVLQHKEVMRPRETPCGKVKSWGSLSKTERAFLLTATLSFLVAAAFTIHRLVSDETAHTHKELLRDRFSAIVVLIGIVFLWWYTWHGVLREKPLELYAFIGATVILGAYIIYNFSITRRTGYKIARFVCFIIGSIITVLLALSVLWDFGWLIIRTVGADPSRQKKIKTYAYFTTFLFLDLQAALSLLVFSYHPGLNIHKAFSIILTILIALTVIMAIVVWCGVCKEQKCLIFTWIVFAFFEPIHVAVMCILIGSNINDPETDKEMAYVVFATCIVAVLIRVALGCYVWKCYRKFEQNPSPLWKADGCALDKFCCCDPNYDKLIE